MNKHQLKKVYYGNDSQQFAHLYTPSHKEKLTAVVIVIHGGYWKDNHTLETYATSAIVDYLQGFNVAIWNLEYRRMDSVGDNIKAPWPATFKDIAAGIDMLQHISLEEGLDLRRILLIGHSAGGHLATWAASRSKISPSSPLFSPQALAIRNVISISGILDLTAADDLEQPQQIHRLMGGTVKDFPERYQACNPSDLPAMHLNLTLVHGELDTCVKIAQLKRYKDQTSQDIKQISIPNADHFSMLPHKGDWQESHWAVIKQLIADEIDALA
ncbi:alpha/beta hydrolase [Shewanella sp. 0m-4]